MIIYKIKKELPKKNISSKPYNKNWKEKYNVKLKNYSSDIIDNGFLISFISYLNNKHNNPKQIIIHYYSKNTVVVTTNSSEEEIEQKNIRNNNQNYIKILKNRYNPIKNRNKYSNNVNIYSSYVKVVVNSKYGFFVNPIISNNQYNFDDIFISNGILFICENDKDRLIMNRKLKIEKIKNGIV